jgi:DNA polymerase (family 10)
MMEVNGSRHRLDLDWRWARGAKDRGIPLCVNPDAHAVRELANVELGVNVARKGGLTSLDIANTASFPEMKELLQGISATRLLNGRRRKGWISCRDVHSSVQGIR